MLGKSFCIFVRLCMILKTFTVACDSLIGVQFANDDELTSELEQTVKELTANSPEDHFIIDVSIANQALSLVHYFNINKLLLATYAIDPLDTFDQTFERICRDQSTKLQIAGPFSSVEQKKINLMKKILMIDISKVSASRVSNGNASVASVEEAMEMLQRYGLGKIENSQSLNHVNFKVFHKVSHHIISQSAELGELIGNLGLPIQGVLDQLLITEQREASVSISHNKKRYREISNDKIQMTTTQSSPIKIYLNKTTAANSTKKPNINAGLCNCKF